MLKSSKKEDPCSDKRNPKLNKIIPNLQQLILVIKNSLIDPWIAFFGMSFFNKSKKDDFVATIKQLKTNSPKMTLDERTILINLFKLEGKTVEDIMIPRPDIAAIKLTTSIEELNKIIRIQIPHTRTFIYDGSLDNIVGFIHIKDLFEALLTKQNFKLKKLIRKHIIAAPSMKLLDLLAKMRRECTHIAIVIDEYGGTDGMVTIEDIMQAIVGRIDDEHDKQSDNDNFKIINDFTIISSARVEVEVLEEVIGEKLKNDDDEFDTIGGLVLTKIGNVPLAGTKIKISDNIEVEIIDATARSLKQVKITLRDSIANQQLEEKF